MHARRSIALSLVLALAPASAALAEDAWNPFSKQDTRPRSRREAPPPQALPPLPTMEGVGGKPWRSDSPPLRGPIPPDDRTSRDQAAAEQPPGYGPPGSVSGGIERQPLPPPDETSRAVERQELTQPVTTSDGSGLPLELWQGIDARAVEELVAALDLPPRSPALNALWRRIWTTTAAAPAGQGKLSFDALRLEALYRSGRINDISALMQSGQQTAGAAPDPLTLALRARIAVGIGEREQGCADAKQANRGSASLPKPIKTELLLLSAYCAAAEGNTEAASLAVDLARAEATEAPLAFSALDALAAGQAMQGALPKRVTLIDYRFLGLAKAKIGPEIVERAEPALLAVLAAEEALAPAVRLSAAEAAARLFAIDAEALAAAYRTIAAALPDTGDPLTAKGDPAQRRAQLFRAIEADRTPMRRTRLVRAFLDESRRAGLYMPAAAMIAKPVGDLAPAQEIGWFAETAIEIGLAANALDTARKWSTFAAGDRAEAGHWAALIDLADPSQKGARGASLAIVEQLAVRGRMPAELMHRLATVLDALDYQIPVPLWDAASRTPQPKGGHLPETGVLSQLQDASKKKEHARAVLLAMRTIGPTAADGAHLIALGDTVRALKRAGLEADARRVALEAVLTGWPRMVGG